MKEYREEVIDKIIRNCDTITAAARLYGLDRGRPLNDIEKEQVAMWQEKVHGNLWARCDRNGIDLSEIIKGTRHMPLSDHERIYLHGRRQAELRPMKGSPKSKRFN